MQAAEQLKTALRTGSETYRAIAVRAGVSPSLLTHFTHNARNLRPSNLDKIANAIGFQFVLVPIEDGEKPEKIERKAARRSRRKTPNRKEAGKT